MPKGPLLVVEDDPQEAALALEALKAVGLPNAVLHLSGAEEALDFLEGRAAYADRQAWPLPSLMLLDLRLGARSGFDLLSAVRSRRELRSLPVVIVTASQAPGDLQRAYELGANSYLQKPSRYPDFVEALKATVTYWLKYNLARDLDGAASAVRSTPREPGADFG